MIKHKHIRTFTRASVLAATGAASLALFPQAASAQSGAGERVYVDLGRWTIVEEARPRSCTLRHAGSGGLRLVMSKLGTNDAQLSLQLANRNVFVGNVTFAFDEDEFPARSNGSRIYVPDADPQDIEAAFRQARVMTLRQGGATLATVSLDGSSAGFRLLKQCSEQGRLGLARASAPPPEPKPAPPPPVRTQPQPTVAASSNLSPPPSLARPAVPRDPQNWVRENDFRSLYRPEFEGTVRYTLIVNGRGRAEECVVDANTGPRELGERVCRTMIRRARFVPALDPNGDPTQWRWSSSFRLEIPEDG